MKIPSEAQAVPMAIQALADLLGVPAEEAKDRSRREARGKGILQADAIVKLGAHRFVIEWKGGARAGDIALAIEQVKRVSVGMADAIPLIAVPFMGEAGRERCEEADVAWMDLSGNARICAAGLRIVLSGKPNRFKSLGRPSSAFAPKSSRIARWLLMHPHQFIPQKGIAEATGMGAGFTSRVIARLEEEKLVVRDSQGAIRPRDPDLLLDAWREHYDFSKHWITCGHIAARSGEELASLLARALQEDQVDYALTGLGGAWFSTRFAGFRLVSVYLRKPLPPSVLERLGFREESRGANVWWILPKDEGVFHGAQEQDGVRCVNPVQLYLDLAAHPERAKEAAERIRSDLLNWRSDA